MVTKEQFEKAYSGYEGKSKPLSYTAFCEQSREITILTVKKSDLRNGCLPLSKTK